MCEGKPLLKNKQSSSSSGGGAAETETEAERNSALVYAFPTFYVLSGVMQPIMMTALKDAGLANPKCQLYMLFYYLGPASVVFSILSDSPSNFENNSKWPTKTALAKIIGISLFDLCAQATNYTGASLAGPTIFAIIYSSVTIWTAVFSKIFLGRSMNVWQWFGIFTVFFGLAITGTDSLKLGQDVGRGAVMVMFGSAMHAFMYVVSEGVMTFEHVTVKQNCAIQGMTNSIAFLIWQIIFTLPRAQELMLGPMEAAGTTFGFGLLLLLCFLLISLVHSFTFFDTLRNCPGGATSAGVMKGLQAVLVFVCTQFIYCGRTGGSEMCFTFAKFISLITVSGGVILFALATQQNNKNDINGSKSPREGYTKINDTDSEDGSEQSTIV